jgi:kynurenine formamidase
MGIVDLLSKGRIVELNSVMVPGKEDRRLDLRRYRIYSGEFMFEIDMMSHLGTHVEAPSHFISALKNGRQDAKDISEYPPDTFWGEAIFINLAELPAGAKIAPEHLQKKGVKKGDIVLVGNSPYKKEGERITMTDAAAKWMAEMEIKLFGCDMSFNMEEHFVPFMDEDFKTLGEMMIHVELMSRDIPVIERLAHLDELKEERFFFIGLPIRIKGCDSFSIRAVAIEGVL